MAVVRCRADGCFCLFERLFAVMLGESLPAVFASVIVAQWSFRLFACFCSLLWCAGARKEGVGGFFKGLGKGLLGVVTKPVVGVVDFTAKTFQVCFEP